LVDNLLDILGPVQNVVSDVKGDIQESLEVVVSEGPYEGLLVGLFGDGQKCFDFFESDSPIFVVDLEGYQSI
jgi:hypothetical protein